VSGAVTPVRSRRRLDVATERPFPAYVVWELTLRCDHACTHCGSRAGPARPSELSVQEALRVVDELANMGTREVVLIGGEAYLHEGFLDVAVALKARGVAPTITTGGRAVSAELADQMRQAGIVRVSVSIDGLEATHDAMRNLKGSYAYALAALRHAREAGIAIAANSNFNRFNCADLEALYDVLRAEGIVSWQIQLTAPLGRAADRPAMIFQPWDLLDFVPRVAAVKRQAMKDGIVVVPGNNLGYFGPEEGLLRSPNGDGLEHFHGCQAGRFVMGIESDGAVKGCPSLQTRHYVGGNLRTATLPDIWGNTPELAAIRNRTLDDLWGFCRTCAFAEPCRGGCTFTAHSLLGRPGNNPYCHFRARELAKRGVRERLVPAAPAPGKPFDNGHFRIIEEPLDAPDLGSKTPGAGLLELRRRT